MTESIDALASAVRAGDRRALAKAITLVESQREADESAAQALLDALLPDAGASLRIGVSGVPGAGKSTLIEALGLKLLDHDHRVAVLAVDPSSSLSGGSILGDKTRMERLSVHPRAFIRPSPAGAALGGVTARSREVILLCEAAGYDRIVVETVGVGQSEAAVAGMTDVFLLLQLPNAGDELQAMKKGVLELADIVIVNKADLDPNAAERAARQLESALRMVRPRHEGWSVPVVVVSALTGAGFGPLIAKLDDYAEQMRANGRFADNRRAQALAWMQQLIDEGLARRFRAAPEV
ncbi:MAG: methylmalonyl Co-A mutase-associated GTPase MeaB, partial [Gammaproteobacteria bacterium]|nr:methylmalonyl Co-A mutase-associated GTPase MeaB [Gammaproteobacteria bacterium]